jgi:AcrR family transcriptional regulator
MRADARRNRLRIIEAARTVFAETGTEAQMDDVAAAAGVGVGTVYRHFPNKDRLMGELLVQKFETIMETLQAGKDRGGDPGEALLASLVDCAERVSGDTATQHILSGPQPPAVWEAAAPTLEKLNALSTEMIEAGIASGTLRHDMVVTDIRLLMGGVASTMADPALRPLWRRHIEILLDGLRAH